VKKLIIIVLTFAMLTKCFGCAGFGKWSQSAQEVVDFICTPSDAEKAEAAKWLTVLDNIQAGVSVAFPAISIMQASAVMTTIKNGGCFILSEVQMALDLLNNMEAKQATVLMIKSAPQTIAEQFPALIARINSGK
jgi:hypothetical protein